MLTRKNLIFSTVWQRETKDPPATSYSCHYRKPLTAKLKMTCRHERNNSSKTLLEPFNSRSLVLFSSSSRVRRSTGWHLTHLEFCPKWPIDLFPTLLSCVPVIRATLKEEKIRHTGDLHSSDCLSDGWRLPASSAHMAKLRRFFSVETLNIHTWHYRSWH